MALFMLDTNVVSDVIRQPEGSVAKRVAEIGDAALMVSAIVAAELRFGCQRLGSAKLTRRVEVLLAQIETVPFDSHASRAYATVRAALERKGTPIGLNDLLIAAHALSLGVTLVTANRREFDRVEGLRVENWRGDA